LPSLIHRQMRGNPAQTPQQSPVIKAIAILHAI
jgi:hypothetical protein